VALALWVGRAAAHLQLCNYEQALSDSQESIQRDPTYSKAYSRLGHAYMGLHRCKEAIDLGFRKVRYPASYPEHELRAPLLFG